MECRNFLSLEKTVENLNAMQTPCIKEASKACSGCCPNPFLGQPEAPNPNSKSTKTANSPQPDFISANISSSIQPNTPITNHESLPPLTDLYCNLKKADPRYSNTDLADQIRSQEYHHLIISNQVCLDYVGNGLFSYSQKQSHYSANAPATASTSSSPPPQDSITSEVVVPFFDISYKSVNLNSLLRHGGQKSEFELAMRRRIMKYMNISEDDYSMVFTANQTSAFKLLADSYPFQTNHKLLTVYDYKNEATEAMIESSKKNGARTISAEFLWPSLRVKSKKLRKMIIRKRKRKKRGLFVFPLQSRVTGAKYSCQWMKIAQENGWHVLLDADALGAKEMETLGLTLFRPDFVVSSFYKIFGENPSGFSCLFVKKSSISVLKKSSAISSIGIVSLMPTGNLFRQYKTAETTESKDQIITLAMLFEKEEAGLPTTSSSSSEETFRLQDSKRDGKIQDELSFSEFVRSDKSVVSEMFGCRGLDHADEIGLVLISCRNICHVNWLVNALLCLRHPNSENGASLVRIYGPKISIYRGSAVAFNVFDWKGEKIDPILVQKLADRNNISLACGFLQHICFGDNSKEEEEKILGKEITYRSRKVENGKRGDNFDSGISVVTASVSFLNNFEDLYRLWAFVSRFLDADFVEKERWRYTALNQTTVEV